MTREEFGIIMGYLVLGTGKELSLDAHEVYFDCLGDLDAATLQIAAKRVLMEHKWATFPSVAELREAASLTVRGTVSTISPADAWDMAWRAIQNIDPEVQGSIDKALKKLPLIIQKAIRGFGLLDLCYGKEPVGVLRGQFMKQFEQIAASDKREALLPSATKEAIEMRKGELAAPVRQAIAGIGKDVA